MGQQQSSMICSDEAKKCSLSKPIPYKTYSLFANTIAQNDPNKQSKLNKYVCGNQTGTITECCDINSPDANKVAPIGSNLINPILDATGKIIEYQICKCSTSSCQKQNCAGFKQPTNYELCKARSVDPKNVIHVNPYVDRILENHTYPTCYPMCNK